MTKTTKSLSQCQALQSGALPKDHYRILELTKECFEQMAQFDGQTGGGIDQDFNPRSLVLSLKSEGITQVSSQKPILVNFIILKTVRPRLFSSLENKDNEKYFLGLTEDEAKLVNRALQQ